MQESRFDGRVRYRPSGADAKPPTVLLRDLRKGRSADKGATGEEEFTLLLVHHAGGSALSFLPLRSFFPDHWRLLALELPGRGPAAAIPAPTGLAEAVSLLTPVLTEQLTGPYALFGHSMGALIAYELARQLERLGLPPVLLGVSASPAPHVREPRDGFRDLHTQEDLAGFLRDLGGTPPQAFEEPELMAYLTHALRLDLNLMQNYTADPTGVLGIPLSVYYGDRDPLVGREMVSPWSGYSSEPTEIRPWPGGHFYLFDRPQEFAAQWTQDVHAAMRRAQGHGRTRQGASWA